MRYVCIQDISVVQLSTYRHAAISELSCRIAASHTKYIASADKAALDVHLSAPHEFGIQLVESNRTTVSSQCRRLSDPVFWFRKLNQVAASAREEIAVKNFKLGDRAYGLEPYCSDEGFDAYLERQQARSVASLARLRGEIEKAAHLHYLTSKALTERAFESGFLSLFITLGLDGRYHSSSPDYQGLTFDDAHAVLHRMYESLIASLSKRAKCGCDFFGIRCIEVHTDGCPHWHLVLYIRPDLLPLLTRKLKELHHDHSQAMGFNFDTNQGQILQSRTPDDKKTYQEAISYIFKSSYAGRSGDIDHFIDAVRQKVAISAYGKRQYQFIGFSGRVSKLRELRKSSDTGGIANELVLSRSQSNRRQRQFNALKCLLSGAIDRYHLVKKEMINRYGEKVFRVVDVEYQPTSSPIASPRWLSSGVICNYSRLYENYLACRRSSFFAQHISSYLIRAPPIDLGSARLARKRPHGQVTSQL